MSDSAPPAPGTPTIFVITRLSIGKDPKDRTKVIVLRDHTWGWQPTLEGATQSVMENEANMYEMGHYNAVVIEEFARGANPLPVSEHWFEVEYMSSEPDTYKVTPIAKPPALERYIGFAW